MAMIKKLLFTLSLCMLVGSVIHAQSTIKGEIKGSDGNPIPYSQVLLKQDGKVVNLAYTDDAGAYQIFGVQAGTYDITAGGSVSCATLYTEKGIYVSSSEVKFVNLTINCSTELEEVEVVYVPPVFNPDNTKSSLSLSGEDVRKMPGRSITSALANLEGVASTDGKMTSVRGNRSDGQQTIIDGVRVRGNNGVTMQSIEGAELIQGGIPAEYGDGTSFTVITTRGIAKDYHGGIELRSSLEGYGQMLGAANVSGPLLKGKNPQDPARIGFLLSAEGTYDKDDRPLRGGYWVAKPDVIDQITKNPILYKYSSGNYTINYAANELGKDAFKKIKTRQNAEDWGILAQAKLDFMGGGKDARGRSKNNLRISIGGSYQYGQSRNWLPDISPYNYNMQALFNSKNNGVNIQSTLRLNARINHRVKTDTAANAILKNVMYDININYTLYNNKNQDINHKDNLFAYGYIGKFTTERQDGYDYDWVRYYNGVDSINLWAPILTGYQDERKLVFDKDGYLNDQGNYYNPDLIYYTQNFVDFVNSKTDGGDPDKIKEIFGSKALYNKDLYTTLGALLNGDSPNNFANGLYYQPGTVTAGYLKQRQEAIGAKASLSLNLKDHEIKFGFELEKLTTRTYQMNNPQNLWSIMRAITSDPGNFAFDWSKPYWKNGRTQPFFQDGMLMDTLMYEIIPIFKNFEQKFRERRGITNNLAYLDVDSYNPKDFRLEDFSNYELLNGGYNYGFKYSGYDYTGKISNKKLNLKNFFGGIRTEDTPQNLDQNDPNKYVIGAFEPIYLAIYLQDKFSISNLLFNVGLRLDYFNANQPVLKDPFLLRDAYQVGELKSNSEWSSFKFPDNVGDHWVPYILSVDQDLSSATQDVVAYRNGKTWYNALGQEVTDPTTYLGNGGPILKNSIKVGEQKTSYDAFTTYRPQLSLMPRISFSFPVSTNSLFYAHYNIITYRPTNLQINPVAYLFIDKYQSYYRIIANPALRAQRSVDYEIGFRQKIGNNTALNIAAYYSEKRDQIQSYAFVGAYPNKYYSYENQDFGTVQGFVLGINMRGTKNLTFRASYTLSFAKGTGSDPQSNLAMINQGQPNLRTLVNLSFDQRHKISASIDLRFDEGINYNGPRTVKQKKGTDNTREIRWLENAGATLLLSAASGMPYTRAGVAYSTLNWEGDVAAKTKGNINGASMPWSFQCDLRLDKTFSFNMASKNDKNEGGKRKNKTGMLTVYLDFQNLFNIKNIIDVYQYTGKADDDGYIASSLFQRYVTSGSAFNMPIESAQNYYEMGVNNPYNYAQPFRVYLGLQFSF